MKDAIRAHVEELFQPAPATRRSRELKDELITNLTDRYDDLLQQGEEPKVAYEKVIDGIGDVEELIAMLKEQDVLSPVTQQKQQQKSAVLVSAAVGLYILALIPSVISSSRMGNVLTLLIAAVATMLLVYNSLSRPRYHKTDDSIVENFKDWTQTKSQRKAVMASINSIIWMVAVIVYLLSGFILNLWHIAWIVFLVAVAVGQVVRLIFLAGEDNN